MNDRNHFEFTSIIVTSRIVSREYITFTSKIIISINLSNQSQIHVHAQQTIVETIFYDEYFQQSNFNATSYVDYERSIANFQCRFCEHMLTNDQIEHRRFNCFRFQKLQMKKKIIWTKKTKYVMIVNNDNESDNV